MAKQLVGIVLALAAVGCGDGTGDCVGGGLPAAGALSVVLGVGNAVGGMTAVGDGDPIEIECGSQGGYDLPMAIKVDGAGLADVSVEMAAYDAGGSQIGFGTNRLDFSTCNVNGVITFLGNAQGIGGKDLVEGLVGTPIRVTVKVTAGATSATDEVSLTPALNCTPPGL